MMNAAKAILFCAAAAVFFEPNPPDAAGTEEKTDAIPNPR